MAIVINGSGTVTGISVGGLPDAIVDSGTLAVNSRGTVLQVVNTQDGADASGTGTIALDDSIPQIGEGDEVMSLAITPTSATSKLKIDVVCFVSSTVANRIVSSLFQDSTANALAAGGMYIEETYVMNPLVFSHYMTAGTTSATTFKVRVAQQSAGTFTFNGRNSNPLYGGVIASSITITEIAV